MAKRRILREKRPGLLTSRRTPLYTARPDPFGPGPCGGIGRRARLKIEFRKECWFDSGQGHQTGIRPRSPMFTFISKDGPKLHFGLRGCSPGFARQCTSAYPPFDR